MNEWIDELINRVCLYVSLCVCMYVCMYACMHACMQCQCTFDSITSIFAMQPKQVHSLSYPAPSVSSHPDCTTSYTHTCTHAHTCVLSYRLIFPLFIFLSLQGTAIGVAIAAAVGNDFNSTVMAFASCAALNATGTFLSLRQVPLQFSLSRNQSMLDGSSSFSRFD